MAQLGGQRKDSGIVVAHFQAGIKAAEPHTASIGYVVGRPFQKRGFASEGLEVVFSFLKETFSIREVKAWSDTRNVASHELAKKLGMVQVDIIKNADFFKGASSDEYVFSKVLE